MQVMSAQEWRVLADRHQQRAADLTRGRRQRRQRGEKHPVDDFLFEYYGFRPGLLARWHPGPGIGMVDATDHAGWTFYCTDDGVTSLDLVGFRERRGRSAQWILDLLRRVHSRPPRFTCFGLHEWAIVYQLDADEIRHQQLPLRLTRQETDDVVRAHALRCTHFDAFRFFTPAAVPRNERLLLREEQHDNEQPGCLHGGVMDLYRWAFKLSPGIPGDLLLDCFALARQARLVDMRSSPYDVSSLGLDPIRIETAEGKDQHVRLQRELSAAAHPLRERLITAVAALVGG